MIWLVSRPSGQSCSVLMLGLVYEMKHQLPAPLKPRVFTILTMSGIPQSSDSEFLIATLPLALSTKGSDAQVPSSKYANSSAVVHGAYVAVEHVSMKPATDGSAGRVVWMMATASDAKGVLPMAIQKMGIPPAITKDVGLMLSYASEKRGGKA